jgi:ribosome-associated protein
MRLRQYALILRSFGGCYLCDHRARKQLITKTRYNINSKFKALAIAGASSEKKALDITIVDMRKMSSVCSYFVIASGTSTTQVRAIADNIERRLKEKQERIWHAEGEREALWILLDAGDVVAHVFLDQTRRFYDLERLWADAPQERFREGALKLKGGSKSRLKLKKVRRTVSRRPKSRPKKKTSRTRKKR